MHKNSKIWQHPTIAAILAKKQSRDQKIIELHHASRMLSYDVIAAYFDMKAGGVSNLINRIKERQKHNFFPRKKAA
jgi:hypothetical protein